MKRQYAKSGTLPIEYNKLILEDAEINSFTPPSTELITVGPRRYLRYLKDNGQLRLCIPRKLYTPFLQMAHKRNNHSRIDCTYQKLCLVNKRINYTPSRKLIPIAEPASPWELVTMDFAVKLPPCKPKGGLWAQLTEHTTTATYDSFLTITDKLTKYVVLVPGYETWTAQEWVQAYFDKAFPMFRVPGAAILDCSSVFVSLF
jgi:hypothetical protein